MAHKLVIGNKNASSWSLRPWLAMRVWGIPFEEINVDLRAPDAKAQILARSPSGKVPGSESALTLAHDPLPATANPAWRSILS